MSKRVITSVTYDLSNNVLLTAPKVAVAFTNQADDGSETHGRATFTDAEAYALFPRDLLTAVNAALDAKAAAVVEPGSVAARVTAADDAERRLRAANAALEATDAQLAAKRAEVATLEAPTEGRVS